MRFPVRLATLLCSSALLLSGCKRTKPAVATGDLSSGLSSGDRALQTKLEPVIECINHTFARFQELQPTYRKRIAQITSSSDEVRNGFPIFVTFHVEPYEQNAQYSRECSAGLKKAASLSPSLPEIDGPAKEASQALLDLIQPGTDMEAYLEQKRFLNDNFERGRQLDAVITPILDRVVNDADKLQDAVHQQETMLHQHELDAIEKKYGRNLTWHTRNSITAARNLNDTLVTLARGGNLTPATVATAERPLQTAYDGAAEFARSHPDLAKPNPNGDVPMWFKVNDDLSRELGYVNELQQTLAGPRVERENVVSSLNTITSNFNSMIQTYNLMEQNHMTTD